MAWHIHINLKKMSHRLPYRPVLMEAFSQLSISAKDSSSASWQKWTQISGCCHTQWKMEAKKKVANSKAHSCLAVLSCLTICHFLHWVWLWYMACTYEWQMWYNSLPVYSARRTELSLWTATKEKLRPSDHLGTEFCHQPQRTGMAAPSPGEPSDKTVAPVYTSPQPVIVQEADDPAHPGWTPHSQTGCVLISVHWLCHMTDTREWANKNMLLWTVNHLSDILPLWNTNLIHQKLLLSEEDMFISGHLRADSRKEKEHK